MAGVEPSFDGFTDRPHYRMSTPTMQRKPRESNTTRCRAQSLAGTLHTTVDSASISTAEQGRVERLALSCPLAFEASVRPLGLHAPSIVRGTCENRTPRRTAPPMFKAGLPPWLARSNSGRRRTRTPGLAAPTGFQPALAPGEFTVQDESARPDSNRQRLGSRPRALPLGNALVRWDC